jgi:DNA-binding response OmpR family regulator
VRVLLLEDEALIASLLADWLAELGHEVVGPVASAEAALTAVDSSAIEAAVLDLHVRDGDSCGVASRLRSGGIPFAFASGAGREGLPEAFRDGPVLSKPFDFEELEGLVRLWERSPGPK